MESLTSRHRRQLSDFEPSTPVIAHHFFTQTMSEESDEEEKSDSHKKSDKVDSATSISARLRLGRKSKRTQASTSKTKRNANLTNANEETFDEPEFNIETATRFDLGHMRTASGFEPEPPNLSKGFNSVNKKLVDEPVLENYDQTDDHRAEDESYDDVKRKRGKKCFCNLL